MTQTTAAARVVAVAVVAVMVVVLTCCLSVKFPQQAERQLCLKDTQPFTPTLTRSEDGWEPSSISQR